MADLSPTRKTLYCFAERLHNHAHWQYAKGESNIVVSMILTREEYAALNSLRCITRDPLEQGTSAGGGK